MQHMALQQLWYRMQNLKAFTASSMLFLPIYSRNINLISMICCPLLTRTYILTVHTVDDKLTSKSTILCKNSFKKINFLHFLNHVGVSSIKHSKCLKLFQACK